MTDYPKHLERHKQVYERHKAGETYVSISIDLGITPPRVAEIARRWERQLSFMKKKTGVCPYCGNPLPTPSNAR